jgi:hypothetical protein
MQADGKLQAGMHAVCATMRLLGQTAESRRKSNDGLACARGGYVTRQRIGSAQTREEQIVYYIWQTRAGNGVQRFDPAWLRTVQAKGLRISKAPCDVEDRLAETANEREGPAQKQIALEVRVPAHLS